MPVPVFPSGFSRRLVQCAGVWSREPGRAWFPILSHDLHGGVVVHAFPMVVYNADHSLDANTCDRPMA